MHRPTGQINPDAPLGHHVGQDVGHITSTVLGASLHLNDTTFEVSTFNGTEPEPTQIDLPMGALKSWSARVIREVNPRTDLLASVARVRAQGSHHPDAEVEWRYSASVYHHVPLDDAWTLQNALIYGALANYEHARIFHSFGEEFVL
jgi:hypothetical protein